MSTLEARIQHLEDVEAIRRLKHFNYCHCVDRSVAGDKAALEHTLSRLADNVVADFTGAPLMEGKEAVAAFLTHGVPMALTWSQHRVMNEVIDIDGDTARASWYLACPVLFREGGSMGISGPGFIEGRYEEEFARINGQWMWTRIRTLLDVQNTFEKSWSEAKFLFANR